MTGTMSHYNLIQLIGPRKRVLRTTTRIAGAVDSGADLFLVKDEGEEDAPRKPKLESTQKEDLSKEKEKEVRYRYNL